MFAECEWLVAWQGLEATPGEWAGMPLWAWIVMGFLLAVGWKLSGRRNQWKPRFGRIDPTPMTSDDLPAEADSYMRAQQAKLGLLGFQLVGTYQTVHDVRPTYSRYLSIPDGDMFAEIDVVIRSTGPFIKFPSICAVTFVSVFEDGTSIQTSNLAVKDDDTKYRTPQLVFRFRPGISMADLLEDHRQAVAAHAAGAQVAMLRYPAEQVVEVSVYYEQYQRDQWESAGLIEPPPPRRSATETKPTPENTTPEQEPAHAGRW